MDVKEVERIYNLSHLSLENQDKEMISQKFNRVLDFIEDIFEVDTDEVCMTEYISTHDAVFREDKPKESLSRSKALENAKDTEFGYFRLDWKL